MKWKEKIRVDVTAEDLAKIADIVNKNSRDIASLKEENNRSIE